MKEQLYRFRLPLIAAAVILLFVVAALLFRLAGGAAGGETEDYFEGSLYPATCEEREDGTLLVTVDGSATPELNWQVENESTDLCEVSIKKKEKNGVLTVQLTPKATGYPSVYFTRVKEISGEEHAVAGIHVEGVIDSDETGKLSVKVLEIYQDAAAFGAADTETPYIIEGCQVLLPNGGDWELYEVMPEDASEETSEDASSETSGDTENDGLFICYTGRNDDGVDYVAAYPKEEADQEALFAATLELHSETLQITQPLSYRINAIGDGELVPAESRK